MLYDWSGEAVAIKLPLDSVDNSHSQASNYLFSLLGNPVEIAKYSFKPLIETTYQGCIKNITQYYLALSTIKGKVDIPCKHYPRLVMFDDIDDSKTVKIVNSKKLDTHFTKSIKLHKATLEICELPVTRGDVENVLKWLPDKPYQQLDGDMALNQNAKHPIANSISVLEFTRHEQITVH